MLQFTNNILVVGYGAVAQCTLPILFKHIDVPPGNVTVLEYEDRAGKLAPWTARGVRFVRERITPENMARMLGEHLTAGDLLIDLAWNIDTGAMLQWCHDHGVLYTNASVELWDPYAGISKHPTERTLYWRHLNLRRMVGGWDKKGPTAVIEHGANPGLISHFTKQGLIDIGRSMIADAKVIGGSAEEIDRLISAQNFNRLAWVLGVRVIHCSERDTQVTNVPKRVGEFVNTWSVEGFREEGTTTAELGWGTHEKWLPPFAYQHAEGPQNQICFARMGMNTWVRSWVPDYTILGMVIRHGEAFTISDQLTVWHDRRAVYRPTVHYAYCPCDSAIASLNELRGCGYRLVEKHRILNDEITGGSDILGALIMGHAYNSWWIGSDLSIEESRRLVPHQNATTMQVAIAVVAGAMWMIENPERGYCVPDDLPHDYVLAVARPYLGNFISRPSDWSPLRDYRNTFDGYNQSNVDLDDPWQFKNFLVKDGD
ncbi:MAG: saccharopine dehydrogenase C-terminal domain-containing protein [Opitutaceae bacterium]|nr:saccharopine dehydrogenase C-terminal domain-containing protein [Opitutaceae bacterium]